MPQTMTVQLPPGVARAASPAATPGRWYDGNHIRWQAGALSPTGGWERATPAPLASKPREMLAWQLNTGTRITAIACDNKIFVEYGGEYVDITPAGFVGADSNLFLGGYGSNRYNFWDYGTPRPDTVDVNAISLTFSLDNWGQDLLYLGSTDGRLLRWAYTNPITAATVVSTAPISNRAMVVTQERHVMLIGAGGNPRRIGWSSREDYTDWNFASTTNTAGFLDVESSGPLVNAVRVREGILVFSESDVWLVRYVGLPALYGAEKIGTNVAPLSPQSIAVFEGRAAWMGREAFWSYEGGTIRPLASELGDFVYDYLDRMPARYYASAGNNGLFPEVWFFYPDTNSVDGENNRYVIWNYAENWWAPGEMRRTCICPAGTLRYPLMGAPDGTIFQHETGWLGDGQIRDVFAETSTISLGSGDRTMSVTRAQPDSFHSYDATRFKFYTRAAREGAESIKGPYVAKPNGVMDVRLTARDIRIRVEATKAENWTVGNMRFEINQKGRR